MQEQLVSVIIPIYGIERYIGFCIESVINQTYKNLEIILVDDGSPDRCPEICDLYAAKDKRIKVIHKKNGGLVSARKAGILAATGDYVGYVDGDDWIEPTFYEWLYREIKEADADLVVAGHSRDLFDKTTHLFSNIKCGIYEKESLKFLYKNMMSYGTFYKNGVSTYVWNKLFKRDLLKKYQLLVNDEITIGEDAAVVYPLLTECRKIVVSDNTDYHYRQREDSMLKKSKPFCEEKYGLHLLYEYLSQFFACKPSEFNYSKQIIDFVLGICIMRSGGLSVNSHILMPFKNDFKDKKVVIYSAGTFGQQLVNRIIENEYCKISGWVDDDFWEYRRCCLNVDPIENISVLTYDFILIATIDSGLSERIKDRLMNIGVDSKKILSVNCSEELRKNLLIQYLEQENVC